MTYTYSGYLGIPVSVNRSPDGATVAIIKPDGTLHADYEDNPLTLQWIADTPDWEDQIAALPEPDEPSFPDWQGFRVAIALSTNYQDWYNSLSAANAAIAMSLTIAASQDNGAMTQALLDQALGIEAFDSETETEMQGLIDQYSIPLEI